MFKKRQSPEELLGEDEKGEEEQGKRSAKQAQDARKPDDTVGYLTAMSFLPRILLVER